MSLMIAIIAVAPTFWRSFPAVVRRARLLRPTAVLKVRNRMDTPPERQITCHVAWTIVPHDNHRAMDFFNYRDGQLHCEAVPASRIAAEVGTPVYVYSKATF